MILCCRGDPLARHLGVLLEARVLEAEVGRGLARALADIAPGGEAALILEASTPLRALKDAVQAFSVWAEERSMPARVVLRSGAAVYASPKPGLLLREEDADAVAGPGGAMLAAEREIGERARRRGFRLVVARFFEVLAPGIEPLSGWSDKVRRGDRHGYPGLASARDYLDQRDAIRAIAALARAGLRAQKTVTVNVCSGRPVTGRELLREVAAATGCGPAVAFDATGPEPAHPWIVGSPERYVALVGHAAASIPLAQTVRECLPPGPPPTSGVG